MDIVCWNARGLRGPNAFHKLRRLVVLNNPFMLFVIESRLSSRIAQTWRTLLQFDVCFVVEPIDTGGGLLLFAKNNEVQDLEASTRIWNLEDSRTLENILERPGTI